MMKRIILFGWSDCMIQLYQKLYWIEPGIVYFGDDRLAGEKIGEGYVLCLTEAVEMLKK